MGDIKIKQRAIAEAETLLIQRLRRREGVSRVELARELKLAPSTVGLYVDRLIDDGLVREGRKAHRESGRPPTTLELNPAAGEFIGVDFDARQMAVVAVNFSQQVVRRDIQGLRVSDSATDVVRKVEQAIATAQQGRRLLGIGVAVPGTLDLRDGLARHYEYIRGWTDVPLVERLSRRFRVSVSMENNIRAMALAEQAFGESRNVNNFICLAIRSGIGAGIILNGRLHRGHDDLAGEIGGWPCDDGLKDAGCLEGPAITLERVASVRAILEQLAVAVRAGASTALVLKRNRITLDDALQSARSADPLVMQTLRHAARAVGRVIGQLSLLLNPQQVILAGPLADLTEAFLQPVRDVVSGMLSGTASPIHSKSPQVAASQLLAPQLLAPQLLAPQLLASGLGAYGGALGAAALAVQRWKPTR